MSRTSGVFILGMHRSGTSAVTRAVNLLGIPLCVERDLMFGYSDNPHGHWESESLAKLNERLLHLAYAAWDCPPAAEGRWLPDTIWGMTAEAHAAFDAAHPDRPWAWKDPRLCVLLPFWRRALPGRHAAILVLRHPWEIAASLARRDGLPREHILAMWERYLRLGLRGCAGLPVLVLDYDEVLNDPPRACGSVGSFLRACRLAPRRDQSDAVASIRPNLRHHTRADGSPCRLTPEQQNLWLLARSLTGGHRRFASVILPAESPGVSPLIDSLRRHWGYVPAPPAHERRVTSKPPAFAVTLPRRPRRAR